jgi:hypothetical protein
MHTSPEFDGPMIELTPEIMLPEQFDELRGSGVVRLPEHRLMLAVLEDAVHTYQMGACGALRNQRLEQETEAWFASEETGSPFAFVTICETFGIDPEWVRAGLGRWRARRTAGRRGAQIVPFRIRRVSGSRHQVTMSRASRRRT